MTLIYYWNEKIVVGKKQVSYEAPPPTATIIRSGVSFEDFLEKLYQVTGFEKLYTVLVVIVDIR